PSAQLMIESLKVLETFNPLPLYSRFDFVSDAQGRPCLIELEVTEPSLYLRYSSEALEIFSQAIVDKLALIKV
ncbi:MAG: hypothetical protein K2X66_07905, partial [Cyanobacteria bacterium]|nr:hypothetical protein [Cyanobacteriota bacterium]